MSRPIIKIHNIETGEIVEREYNDEEFAVYEHYKKLEAEREAEKAALEAKRQALLSKLGITEDEAKLLLGGN
jgi:hypothetical protein